MVLGERKLHRFNYGYATESHIIENKLYARGT